ncbi:MAG: serine/threonine protein kinase [Ktedonobacterales bacterium]
MPQSPSQTTLPAGTVISKRYRIERLIGTGGYASVYRATDLTLGYERAIKEVADPDPGVRTQFRLEAELLINSKHPNIPHGYHLIEDMGRLFLIMDYVHGKDLEELLNESLTQRQRALDEAQVLTWAMDICDALDKMHNLKVPVIHRDIKPANIKITPENQPILIDFGLAKLQQRGATLTAAQGVSPGFAPPEQYMAKGRTDPRTDIYGLGATLYACLTGKDPPEAPGRLLAQTGTGGGAGMQLVPPRKLNPSISESTDRLIVRALELSPNHRQQSAHELQMEMQTSLQRLTGGSATTASSSGTGATMVMGVLCPRCGTQNRPDAARCAECGFSLRGYELPVRPTGQHPAAGSASDASGKQSRLLPPAGNRTNVKSPGTGVNRTLATQIDADRNGRTAQIPAASSSWTAQSPALNSGKQPAVSSRSGKQPAVRTGKESAVALESSSGKHRAVGAGAGAVALPTARATSVSPAVSSAKATNGASGVSPKAGAAAKPKDGAWIRLGTTALNGFDKIMLTLAGIEVLWGCMILALGIVSLVLHGNTPVLQLVGGWVVVVLVVSILGAQALSRPIYRRAKLGNARRWLQGAFILLYSIVVQAAGVWGVMVFHNSSPTGSSPLAVVAYLLFGISALIAGIFGISTVLG